MIDGFRRWMRSPEEAIKGNIAIGCPEGYDLDMRYDVGLPKVFHMEDFEPFEIKRVFLVIGLTQEQRSRFFCDPDASDKAIVKAGDIRGHRSNYFGD